PVMITVANRTETAARIKHAFDTGGLLIKELCDPERTLHIDSKVLGEAEAQDEPVAVGANDGEGDSEDESGNERDDGAETSASRLTKKQRAELLRRQVDTVGRVGEPGEQIQNVISVGMLSEGWDAKTVTHIMGLRAFSSQLLCEQVVGRGLRRTSYDFDPDKGLFEPEHVNVFGVPFSFMPHESADGPTPAPPTGHTEIRPLPEREAEFGLSWPNVLKVERTYAPRIDVDLSKMDVLTLRASETPQIAELAPTVEGKPDTSRIERIEIERLAHDFRLQKIAFETARKIADAMRSEWKGSPTSLLAQLVGITERFLASDRLRIEPEIFHQDPLRRRVLIALRM